jgi:Tol biopolymer transport system component
VHDPENRRMTRTSPRRSYLPRIAITVATAMLMAGCGSSPEARPTESTSTVDAGTTTQATPTPVKPAAPRPSPGRSGSLAYGVGGDIYVADWDGSNPVRIAAGEYWGEGAIWSPDGRYLAYRDPSRNVVISDPQGNVVAEFPAHGWDIAWSPDSTRVAVWIRFGETIGVFGVDGERQALLTLPSGFALQGDTDPIWVPNGGARRESLLVQDDVVVPVDGSTPYNLPLADRYRRPGLLDEHPSQVWGVTYSPDGSRAAYVVKERSLVVAEADGSNPQVVFPDSADPVWSPNGDRIAFGSWREGGRGVHQLRVLDVASGTVTLLADGSDMLDVIDFSPEGDRILFSKMENGRIDVGSLWSVNAGGSDLRRLITETAWGDWLSLNPTT